MVIIISGSLGVGKTTISKLLSKKLQATYLSVDEILHTAGLDKISEGSFCIPLDNFIRANELMKPIILAAAQESKSVIVDGCFYHKEASEHLKKIVDIPCVAFTLRAPIDVCLRRDKARRKSLGEKAARAVFKLTSSVTIGVVMDATKPTQETVTSILDAVELRKEKG